MTPETITIIAAVLAGASSFGLAVALRALSRERTKNTRLIVRLTNALYDVETWKRKAETRTVQMSPDTSPGGSLARALRKITAQPVKPTSARTPPTSRNDSTDLMNGMAMGSLLAPGGWSAPATDTSSCDTSSSSSSDSGSCGGGE